MKLFCCERNTEPNGKGIFLDKKITLCYILGSYQNDVLYLTLKPLE